MNSKLPLPSEVSDFRFLRGANLPGYVVLELDTATNPIRIFLSRDQVGTLREKSGIAVAKIDSDTLIAKW